MTQPLLPCPCCGGTDLHVGHASADRQGVHCRSCGLGLSRGLPTYVPRKYQHLPIDASIEATERDVLAKAVRAWNRRT